MAATGSSQHWAQPPTGQGDRGARLDVAEVRQQVREAVRGQHQHARRLPRVKQVGDEDAEVALQPHHVAVGAVQHLDHLRAPCASLIWVWI